MTFGECKQSATNHIKQNPNARCGYVLIGAGKLPRYFMIIVNTTKDDSNIELHIERLVKRIYTENDPDIIFKDIDLTDYLDNLNIDDSFLLFSKNWKSCQVEPDENDVFVPSLSEQAKMIFNNKKCYTEAEKQLYSNYTDIVKQLKEKDLFT